MVYEIELGNLWGIYGAKPVVGPLLWPWLIWDFGLVLRRTTC